MMDVINAMNSTMMLLAGWVMDPADWLFPLAAELPLLTRWMNFIGVILQVAAGLGFVIFVHEMGHFLAAKTFGVKCEKFYVGFDVPIQIGPIALPRTLGKFRWGETEYGIGIIPLGGYVKMLGQDDDPRNAEAEAQRIRQGEGPEAQLDPRSYQAKPVWQRMIIISAGVVMNVIFAVFLAAAAFLVGVPYLPTTIGALPLGSPAWQAGLRPGDRVVQMAAMTQEDPYLRFEDMGGKTIFHGMKRGATEIPFTVIRDNTRTTINAVPTKDLHPDGYFLVGISSTSIATIGDAPNKYTYLGSQNVDLRKGDKVIAVDGQPLPIDADSGQILSNSMTDKFQAKWNQPVEITVLRELKEVGGSAKATSGATANEAAAGATSNEELKFTLPPVPIKTLGLGFAMGPISGVRAGSIAESAGIKVGDIIEKVNGQDVVDALRLPMQVAEKLGSPVELVIRRPASAPAGTQDGQAKPAASSEGEGQVLTFSLETKDPPTFGSIGQFSAQWGLENFGIAYSVLPKVSWVDPAAEKATSLVEVGDELTQVQFEVTEEEREKYAEADLEIPVKARALSSLFTVPVLFASSQSLPEGIRIRCTFERDKKTREAVLPIYYAKDWFWYQRGVLMSPLQKIQKTSNVNQALSWGVKETGRRLGDVLEFLTILVTGKASASNLAGPWGIAKAASHEASDSPSRLLLFLTLLSANLAILNFLPIPALDGGHLMFLAFEAIFGKPVNENIQVRLTMLGVMCLLGLMAFAILNDIWREIR